MYTSKKCIRRYFFSYKIVYRRKGSRCVSIKTIYAKKPCPRPPVKCPPPRVYTSKKCIGRVRKTYKVTFKSHRGQCQSTKTVIRRVPCGRPPRITCPKAKKVRTRCIKNVITTISTSFKVKNRKCVKVTRKHTEPCCVMKQRKSVKKCTKGDVNRIITVHYYGVKDGKCRQVRKKIVKEKCRKCPRSHHIHQR